MNDAILRMARDVSILAGKVLAKCVSCEPFGNIDSFQLDKTSDLQPAMGHGFLRDGECKCGQDWEQQRREPTICSLLLARLQDLEDLDAAIERVARLLRHRIRKLEDRASRTELRLAEWDMVVVEEDAEQQEAGA